MWSGTAAIGTAVAVVDEFLACALTSPFSAYKVALMLSSTLFQASRIVILYIPHLEIGWSLFVCFIFFVVSPFWVRGNKSKNKARNHRLAPCSMLPPPVSQQLGVARPGVMMCCGS